MTLATGTEWRYLGRLSAVKSYCTDGEARLLHSQALWKHSMHLLAGVRLDFLKLTL